METCKFETGNWGTWILKLGHLNIKIGNFFILKLELEILKLEICGLEFLNYYT